MKAVNAADFVPREASAWPQRRRRFLPLLLSFAIVASAIAHQATLGINPDTSWLITVSERMLGGDRLYVDVFELNPPASVLLTLPPVALANLFGWRPEAVLVGCLILLAISSLGLALRLLRPLLPRQAGWGWLLPSGLFVLLFLPGFNFAQREHLALIACLPWLALMAARASDQAVPSASAVVAGLGAGVTAIIKPHFLPVLLLPLLAASWRQRSLARLFGAESLAMAGVIAAYLLLIQLVFPTFWTVVVPLVADGYLQNRVPVLALLGSVNMLLCALALGCCAQLEGRRLLRSPALMFLLGSVGFGLAVLVQAKGFSNHQYPALAAALLALGLAAVRQTPGSRERRLGLLLFAASAGLGALQSSRMYLYPEVADLIARTAPQRPTVIMAGSNLTMAHPLTRWVDGRWVGTRASLWATHAALISLEQSSDPAQRTRLQRRITEDKVVWLSDVHRHHPDVILVAEGEGDQWIAANPDVRAALLPYKSTGSAQGLTVLVRCSNATAATRRAPSGLPAPGC